jgi:hypothetical protein
MAKINKKRNAHKKPNVFRGSYDIASGKVEVIKSSQKIAKSENFVSVRRELLLNTFPRELKRFGFVTGGIIIILIICAIVFNVV